MINQSHAAGLRSTLFLIIEAYEEHLASEAADGAQAIRAGEAMYSRDISRNIAAIETFRKRAEAIARGDASPKSPGTKSDDSPYATTTFGLTDDSGNQIPDPGGETTEEEEWAEIDRELDEKYDLTSGLERDFFEVGMWSEGDANPTLTVRQGGLNDPSSVLGSGTAHFGFSNTEVDEYFALSWRDQKNKKGTRLLKDFSDCVPLCTQKFADPKLEWKKLRDLLAADWNQRWEWYQRMLDAFSGPKNSKTIADLCNILAMFKDLCPSDILKLIAMLAAWITSLFLLMDFNIATGISDILGQILRPYISGIDAWLLAFWKALIAPITCIIDAIQANITNLAGLKYDTYGVHAAKTVYKVGSEGGPTTVGELREKAKRAEADYDADPTAAKKKRWDDIEAELSAATDAEMKALDDSIAAMSRGDQDGVSSLSDEYRTPGSNIDRGKTRRPGIDVYHHDVFPESFRKGAAAFNKEVDSIQRTVSEAPGKALDAAGEAIGDFLKDMSEGMVNYVEGHLARLQQSLIRMLGLEWGIGTKRMTFMENIQKLIEIISILKALEKLKRTGQLRSLCDQDVAQMVLGMMERKVPPTPGANGMAPRVTTSVVPLSNEDPTSDSVAESDPSEYQAQEDSQPTGALRCPELAPGDADA